MRRRYGTLWARSLDLVIDAGACTAEPTTVVDLAVEPPVIVRLGAGDPARLGMSGDASR